jgi:predicted transcriptional regulator
MKSPRGRNDGSTGANARNHLVDCNEWFKHKVENSIAAVERGETVSDDDVRAWIEQRERA